MNSPPTIAEVMNLEQVTLERYDERSGEVNQTVQFRGVVLGAASSQQRGHRGHPDSEYAPKRLKCSACRWLEVTIYRRYRLETELDAQHDDGGVYARPYTETDYVVYTVGASDVPGEVDFIRIYQTSSAFEVVEILTVRRTDHRTSKAETFLPPQHARALAQAATLDDGIREAYVNRAVA